MWFAARDVAFEHPVTEDMTQTMLARMGIVRARRPAADARSDARGRRSAAPVPRPRPRARDDAAPHDRPPVHRDLGVPHVRVGRGGARPTPTSSPATARRPRSCGYIRADETPHVDYLRTALTEMRDRTFVGESGRKIAGHRGDRHALGRRARAVARRRTARTSSQRPTAEVEHALAGNPRRGRDPRGLPRARHRRRARGGA